MLNPGLRRLAWRAGRRLYCYARGEALNVMAHNGELGVQAAMLAASRRTGRTFVAADVGANVGEWSLSLVRQAAGLPICVHAFEPVDGTRRQLLAAVAEAGAADRIAVHGLALSNGAGARTMHVIGDGAGTNSLEADPNDKRTVAQAAQVTVETDTLSAFAARNGIERFDLVKVDTEGHDSLVIEGAADLLSQERIGALQFEYNHRWIYARHFLKDVFDLLARLRAPYSLGLVRGDGVDLYPEWRPELERFFEANYLLVHRDTQAWFRVHEGAFDASNTYA